MRMKLQVNVRGQWKYVSHLDGAIITTDKAYEALTGDQSILNQLSNDYYGTDFRIVR